ncbi:MAG TPA: phosphoglucosamine mutase [Methanomassiliicoccales archaeon]|nr:phosphoglucosamine mutase [Methanomassiliicoccales archaeon]
MSLFGSSGIRGVVGKDITPELGLKIGLSVGELHERIVIGKDTRTTGDMLVHAVASGAMASGAMVALAGMVPTPTLAHAAKDFDCGLMITASHNPAEYNGVKMWNPDGSAFDTAQMEEVERKIGASRHLRAPWNGVGTASEFEGAAEAHLESILKATKGGTAKVVLDCGNGAASVVSPYVIKGMGCELTTLNCQPDGRFPGRAPEPTDEELADLKHMVVSKGAQLGIAHDGDGDRMVAVDERGKLVDGDKLLALFASKLELDSIVVPVDASMVLDDVVRGKVHRTKVGDVFVAEAIKKYGSGFGGEPSGTFIFPQQTFCPDGILAAATLINMVGERSLAEMVDALPSYPVFRRSHAFDSERRGEVSRRLADVMRTIDCDELSTVDGYRAAFKEGWFLIRLSGTEPKLRMSAEARTKEELENMKTIAEEALGRVLA